MKNRMRYMYVVVSLLACVGVLFGCDDDKEVLGTPSITISSFTPSEGLPGTEVTISASGFGTEAKVFFNETEVSDYVSRSGNSIVVRVPDNASSGKIGIIDGNAFGFSVQDFSFIPSALIEGLSETQAPVGSTIVINGRNFFDVGVENITVMFGSVKATVISATSTAITVIVPEGVESGHITVRFADIQTVTGPEFTVGVVVVEVPDYYFDMKNFEAGEGSFGVGDDGFVGSTKRGAYLVYPFTVEVDGNYEVNAQTATNQGYACYLNMDMGTDMDELAKRAPNTDLSQVMLKQGWSTLEDHTYGPFKLKAGTQYYLRMYFWAEGTSWAGNAGNVVLHYADDQSVEGINVGGGLAYNIYQNDFNEGTSLLPFAESWAWDPCYIKVAEQCAEFYYNHAALEADNRRERRGCEVTCDFKTTTEGWYGFKVFLPEGKFPMDEGGIIIAQIFNRGCRNSWAGHLSIDEGTLKLSHRHALIDPVIGTVGKLETNKWYSVVVHFKAGRNNKGRLRVWLGDDMSEDKPAYDSGNCNFGFGHWIDDDTLDDTGNNSECTGYNGTYDALGCKFGLYVSNKVDITIRFDDLKALEGNPAGAFNIVKPGN
ncbi:IPT/TIG domain-containing protein [Phocaeicola sartorii]|uniref:IPT/TIG domain-containing protein n=1 Tax=Phocaeicola sartorii TaxID=671267 RepID=UPI0035148DC8